MARSSLIKILPFILLFPGTLCAQALSLSVPFLIVPATQGSAYNNGDCAPCTAGGAVLAISGGTGPYTPTITSGALPTGMSMSEVTPISTPKGLVIVTGTPSVSGDFTFTVQVTDGASNTASQSVTLPVEINPAPTITAVTATGITATTATITWTTSIAADSQVCYNLEFEPSLCTAKQDAGGVTSHSVTLTNLWPNTSGQAYFVVSWGVTGGTAKDYLICTGGGSSGNTSHFNTPAAPTVSSGPADFQLDPTGPHNITQGYPLYVGIFENALNVGCNERFSYVVTGIPTNTKVHWPDQQDHGNADGTVSTTTTADDTMINFGPGTDFEILPNVGGTTPAGSYTLTVTVTSVPTCGTQVVHSFTWPLTIAAVSFPSANPGTYPVIPAKALWESHMTSFGSTYATQACNQLNPETIDFYDGLWVYYQIAKYTGDTSSWATGISNRLTCYRDTWVLPFNGGLSAVDAFPHGLYNAYVNHSDTTSGTALSDLEKNDTFGGSLAATHNFYGRNIREVCYNLGIKRLDFDAGLGDTNLAAIKQMVAACAGIIDLVVNQTGGFEQPFMDGLAAQALIDYYMDPNTGNQADTRIPQAIKALADHLWANWIPWVGTNGYFCFNKLDCQLLLNPGNENPLNLLIAPMFGWLYKITGLQQYQLEGDTIFYSGVNGNTGNGIGFSGKNFSQQYRWTFDFVKWRTAPVGFGGTATKAITLAKMEKP